jgi:hypothetical protein
VILIAPALLGIFWGAPLLSREFEGGTYRLAWTQSVTRLRWVTTKLVLVGLATVALASLLTFVITWWYRQIDLVGTNHYAVFDRRDIVPIGYAAFAFTSGALIGAILRRALPAMATTLAVFVFVRVAWGIWIRPHLLTPRRLSISLLDANQLGFESSHGSPMHLVARADGPPHSWMLSSHLVTNSGHVPSSAELSAYLSQQCPKLGLPPAAPPPGGHITREVDKAVFQACADQAARTYHVVVTYQPSARFWTFQWIETGFFVALALLAGATCVWWIARRSA